jgi:PAS domain S-box-containing protein
MDNYKLCIGIALSNDNAAWVKGIIDKEFSKNITFYQVKYDLYSETLDSKIDLLIMDQNFPANNTFKRESLDLKIPLAVLINDDKRENFLSAIGLQPSDIWLRQSISKDRIISFINKVIDQKTRHDELEQFKSVLNHLPLSVVITDDKGDIQYVNPKFENVSGYSYSELLNKNPRVLKSGAHDEQYYKDMWDKLIKGLIWEGEICNKNKNDQLYIERLMIYPYKNLHGQITNYIGIRIDDTDRRKAEALKHIQELSGGIAHEFSQPLQVLTISLSMLETKMRGNDLFARIQRMVNKIVGLVNNLKNITELKQQDYLDTQILDLQGSSRKDNDDSQ